ncbi:MAG: hypothetical protein HY660_07480 [Armatimonadetes bacterium]|nr:hypothetical protein [Armatimonadota bacterium]
MDANTLAPTRSPLTAGRLDLSLALDRVNQLQAELETLYGQAARLTQGRAGEGAMRAFNRGLLRLARILIPLNYVESDQFDQDAALGLPPLPLLGPVDRLGHLEPGSDAYYQHLTLLIRRRNAVCFALREAIEAARSTAAAMAAVISHG